MTTNNSLNLGTTASTVLATNSSGALSNRSFTVAIQTFTGSGTYTPATGMLYCTIECLGGGGGGGGAATNDGSHCSAASGGGSGEYARGVFSAATIGSSQSVTIGAAGSAGSAGNNAGGNGGNTSVGALISANGGTGGSGCATSTTQIVFGGSGGTGGSGGSIRTPGQIGGYGMAFIGALITCSGKGAASQYGGGAKEVFNSAGNAGAGFGSGGGGASVAASSTQQAGGAGTAGYVIVTEYIIN